MEKTILVVVGSVGSGKTETSNFIKSLGIPTFRTGDVIRKAVLDSGLSLTPKNSERMAVELRRKYGNDYPARKTGEKIKQLPKTERLICVEGPRDMDEVDYLATLGRVILLVLEAPIELRFSRTVARKGTKLEPKTRDPETLEEFRWRDMTESERGQAEVTHTDKYPRHVIENTGTKEELYDKVRRIVEKLKHETGM